MYGVYRDHPDGFSVGETAERSSDMKNKTRKRKYSIYMIKYCFPVLTIGYLCLCFSMRLTVRDTSFAREEYMLYYMVNADGMKGLGHSILMMTDEEGGGTVFSFNGMQRSLSESLAGRSGVGKLSVGTMDAEETEIFLRTGDLCLEGDQLTDNYDMALYRPITAEDYQTILEQTAPYREAEEKFTILYEQWIMEEDVGRKTKYEQALEQMGQDKSLPVYQIYTDNCDHTARKLIASIDPDMQDYLQNTRRITPNGNLKAFGLKAENWGVMTLGKQSLAEKLLMFLVSF